MRVEDCITREVVAPDGDLDGFWRAIVVAEEVKDRLLRHAVLALHLRTKLPFTTTALHGLLLLHGPPGTGKTTLVRGLAQELTTVIDGGVRLIEVNPHGLMSAEHGGSQQRVAELLAETIPGRADDGIPTVVLLDEVESMAVARSEASLAANPVDVHRATDAVLTALDDLARSHPHIVTVATSNFMSGLDIAFISRADVAIEVPLPDQCGLLAILRQTLHEYGKVFPSLAQLAEAPSLSRVAQVMVGMDGRSARKLIPDAAARRLETAVDLNLLTLADLHSAAASYRSEGTADDVAA